MTDLTDRMRTCAAHILREGIYIEGELPPVYRDAADLLIEASNILDIPLPAGRQETIAETRAKLSPVVALPSDTPITGATPFTGAMWIGDDLKPIPNTPKSRNACPKCDSRAGKTVKARNETIWLECAVCGHAWIAR